MFISEYTCSWTSLVAQRVKRLPAVQETWVQSLGQEDLVEKEMATHSSTLAWKIPWTEEPARLQSMGSHSRTRVSAFPFFLSLSVRVLTHTYKRAWTCAPVSALLGQALFAVSHPVPQPRHRPLQNLGQLCWGLLLGTASSRP